MDWKQSLLHLLCVKIQIVLCQQRIIILIKNNKNNNHEKDVCKKHVGFMKDILLFLCFEQNNFIRLHSTLNTWPEAEDLSDCHISSCSTAFLFHSHSTSQNSNTCRGVSYSCYRMKGWTQTLLHNKKKYNYKKQCVVRSPFIAAKTVWSARHHSHKFWGKNIFGSRVRLVFIRSQTEFWKAYGFYHGLKFIAIEF